MSKKVMYFLDAHDITYTQEWVAALLPPPSPQPCRAFLHTFWASWLYQSLTIGMSK